MQDQLTHLSVVSKKKKEKRMNNKQQQQQKLTAIAEGSTELKCLLMGEQDTQRSNQ